ncbi:ROK family protein [Mesorhizobium sp. CN5-321]|jgi:predicted NBD/HSP70 family sugar kinase|uniref:ROK family transcriptional regulator n=1 Tax=Mesorhizobium hunchu TaxID=3157708 RepID=UPI0032B77658
MVDKKEQSAVARTGLGGTAVADADRSGETGSPAAADRVRAFEAERQSLVSLLNILRSGEPCTRLDLEREARLGRAVVTDRLSTLAAFGLIDEGGVGRSIGGRAPRLVRFRSEAARILVANIDGDTISLGLADLDGRLILEHYEDFDAASPAAALFDRLEALFNWSLGKDGAPLWAIGLGVPGAVEQKDSNGLVIPKLGAMPAWNEAKLLERLMHRFQAPVWVRGAVQMETMGELSALSAEASRDMLYVDLGSDITAGIVVDGRLHRGAQGIAGQIGHVYAGEPHKRICGCGNVGCLQTVAGCDAIAQAGLLAAEQGRSRLLGETLAATGTLTAADIGTAARLGDPFCADLLAQSGRLIGTVLATLANILNPSMIVLGGELSQTGDICLAAIREGIYRHAQPLISRDISIVHSRMGRSAGLVGAAAVAVTELFAPAFLSEWIVSGTPLAHAGVADLLAGVENTATTGG